MRLEEALYAPDADVELWSSAKKTSAIQALRRGLLDGYIPVPDQPELEQPLAGTVEAPSDAEVADELEQPEHSETGGEIPGDGVGPEAGSQSPDPEGETDAESVGTSVGEEPEDEPGRA